MRFDLVESRISTCETFQHVHHAVVSRICLSHEANRIAQEIETFATTRFACAVRESEKRVTQDRSGISRKCADEDEIQVIGVDLLHPFFEIRARGGREFLVQQTFENLFAIGEDASGAVVLSSEFFLRIFVRRNGCSHFSFWIALAVR